MEAEAGARQPDHAAGIARRAEFASRHPLAQVSAKDRGVPGRAPEEARAPARDRGAREEASADAQAQRIAGRALRFAAHEHPLQDVAAEIHRVMRAGLLEGRQRGERGVRILPAQVAFDADMLGDRVEEDEIAEVVAMPREAAVDAAAQAVRRAREFEPARLGEVPREFAIGLERSPTPVVRCHPLLPAPGRCACEAESSGRSFFGFKEGNEDRAGGLGSSMGGRAQAVSDSPRKSPEFSLTKSAPEHLQ